MDAEERVRSGRAFRDSNPCSSPSIPFRADKCPYETAFQTAEHELRRLQRAYKLLEADRRAYADSAANTLAKQKATIANVQGENAELERQLDVFTKMRTKERTGDAEQLKREIGWSFPKLFLL